jgi:type II secretory pathway pseudopilin PulG
MVPMQSEDLDETSPLQPEADNDHSPQAAPVESAPLVSQDTIVSQPTAPSGDETVIHVQEPAISEPTAPAEDEPVSDSEETGQEPPVRHKRSWGWLLWVVLGILGLALIAGLSAYSGYISAIQDRTANQATQVAGEVQTQYNLALQDITEKHFDLARQRLEYIIGLDPGYPGAVDRLSEVLLEQRITATPTNAPTPTLSPTPDFRGRDQLYSEAQASMAGGDWSTAIETLLTLRKKYPDHMAIEVDGMLYVALRNRGIDKISLESDLEGGTYDLTLAEGFGPLDAEAKNWRDWAELYIRGASFWDVDWSQVVFYFSQLAPAAPNLRDGSGWTATDRYMQGLLKYGDWLAARGEWCKAQEQYDMYMTLLADPLVEPTASHANDKCNDHGGEDEQPSETPTPGGAPQDIPPTATPTPGATDTPSPEDTATPEQNQPTATATSSTPYP